MTTNPALAPASAETTTPFHARNRWRWFGWGLAALAVIWVIVDGKNEIGRWYFAAAEVEFARQHDDLADAYLQRAIAWAPNNYQPYLFRGTTKLAEKDYAGALEDLDRALELGGGRYEILTYHSPALQHMGRHEDAVADWRRIERLTRTPSLVLRQSWYNPRRANDLNNLAYAQALAKIDLDEALKNINAALELKPSPPEACRAMMLETRAFVYCQRGEYQRSIDEMNGAFDDILRVRALVKQLRAAGNVEKAEALARSAAFPPSSLAVFYYHRSLAYEGLGKQERAAADLVRVRELIGHDPDEHLF